MTYAPPAYKTPLIGRADLLDLTSQLLLQDETGIVTLAGPAGVGKTRLAQAIAQQLPSHFGDGVWFVPLDSVSDTMMVLPAIARNLGLQATTQQQTLEAIVRRIDTGRMLLILDNMEHLIASAADIANLVGTCKHLKILVTSRIPLAVRAEQIVTMMPLELPDARRSWDVEALQQIPAVQLFVQRAQLRSHTFGLTATNAKSVIDICTRMDGLPLALELAAACLPALSVEMIQSYLDHVLPLPMLGYQDMPDRHQSLGVAIATSYDLLTPLQQALFRRLSVFVGEFTLEAAAEVATLPAHTAAHTLPAIIDLVHQNLLSVTAISGQHHYRMLATIRSFAYQHLDAYAEAAAAYEKLCVYLCQCVARQKPKTIMQADERWLQRIDLHHNNIIGLLDWITRTDQCFEQRTSLIVDLIPYWTIRGQLLEAQEWLDSVRTNPELLQYPHLHIDVVNGAGLVSAHRGLLDQAYQYHQQAFDLCTTQNDQERLVYTIRRIGYILDVRGQHRKAVDMYEQSLALARTLNDEAGMADAYMNLGHLWHELGNEDKATTALREGIRLAHKVGAKRILAWSWIGLGHIDRAQQRYAAARHNYERARRIFCELYDKRGIAWSTSNLSLVVAQEGQQERALSMADESIQLFQAVQDQRGAAWAYYHLGYVNIVHRRYAAAGAALCQALQHAALGDASAVLLSRSLQQAAQLMVELSQFDQAARFLGLASALAAQDGAADAISGAYDIEAQLIECIQSHVGKTQFTTLWQEGRRLSVDDVVQTLHEIRADPSPIPAVVAMLTRREIDVLCAVAEGLSNQQIAARLTISTGTVRTHLNAIYDKLAVQSRTAAVHRARTLGILP
ncbi:MAG: tetratricopeptide repeat protein [Chloroflexales bacterium]|nr:tetratricopeptide repeat protein [Chloroflexales bacterium]